MITSAIREHTAAAMPYTLTDADKEELEKLNTCVDGIYGGLTTRGGLDKHQVRTIKRAFQLCAELRHGDDGEEEISLRLRDNFSGHWRGFKRLLAHTEKDGYINRQYEWLVLNDAAIEIMATTTVLKNLLLFDDMRILFDHLDEFIEKLPPGGDERNTQLNSVINAMIACVAGRKTSFKMAERYAVLANHARLCRELEYRLVENMWIDLVAIAATIRDANGLSALTWMNINFLH